jgi:hypothetical protein
MSGRSTSNQLHDRYQNAQTYRRRPRLVYSSMPAFKFVAKSASCHESQAPDPNQRMLTFVWLRCVAEMMDFLAKVQRTVWMSPAVDAVS